MHTKVVRRTLFQFSVSGILALTVIVAMALSLRGGLSSRSAPHTISIASFLLAYWWHPNTGRRQVARVVATTAVIWGVVVTWVCVASLSSVRPENPGRVELVLHELAVVAAAAVAAFAAAWGVEGSRAGARWWRRASRFHRVVSALSLTALAALGFVVWLVIRPAYWEPLANVSPDEAAFLALPAPLAEQLRSDFKDTYVVASVHDRFLAAILPGRKRLLIFDSTTGQVAARFDAAKDEWFGDVTFHPDGNLLAALAYSGTAPPKLLRWRAPAWSPREAILLEPLLDHSQASNGLAFSLDRRLVIVACWGIVQQRMINVEIFMADLSEERPTPRAFASGEIPPGKLPALPGGPSSFEPQRWIVSASGHWIAASNRWPTTSTYLFGEQAAPVQLPGEAIGFASDTDNLVMRETSWGFQWRREEDNPCAPPFWNNLRFGEQSRLVIYDCPKREMVARSRWFPSFLRLRLAPDGLRLLMEQGNSLLIWEFPDVSGQSRQ